MTQYWRSQVALVNDSGEAKDQAINTWHFTSDEVGTIEEDVNDISAHLTTFYTDIFEFLSENLTGALVFKHYALLEPPERIPYETGVSGLVPSGSALPNELAICLSYRSDPTSGVRKARRRGRLYIGPLGGGAQIQSGGTGDERVGATVRDGLVTAAGNLLTALAAAPAAGHSQLTWCVFSPTTYAEEAPVGVENSVVGFAASFFPVEGGRVDDAFDIQRRRGRVPTNTSAYVFGNGWF